MKTVTIIFTLLFLNSLAFADKNMKIGSKGNVADVTRVIKVVMYDNYYEPSSFQIKEGETINEIIPYQTSIDNVLFELFGAEKVSNE